MTPNNSNTGKAIFPILFGFFVMGFVDVVGIATNHVQKDFELSNTLANLIPMMVFFWFAVLSIPTGVLMGKVGRRNTVLISFAITAVGMLLPLFAYDFIIVLIAFALLGIGNTILQVSLNPMIASVVSRQKMTSVLTLGQFIKSISSFLGPIIAGGAASFWGDWKLIFVVYSVTSILSVIWLVLSVENVGGETENTTFASSFALFKDKYIFLLFLGILFIVGIDVGLNTTIPKLLMEKTDMSINEAGLGTSVYFASRTIGTFLGAILLTRFEADRFLRYTMIGAIIAFILLLLLNNPFAIFAMIVLVGLGCANVFSIIFSFALKHKPERANEISALMIMGVSGGALIIPLMGVIADYSGQVPALSILLLCMIYITYIAYRNNK